MPPQNTQNTFPFLNLPPELRNAIYTLVLGGHTIHIGKTALHGSRTKKSLCALSQPTSKKCPLALWPHVLEPSRSYTTRHAGCNKPIKSGLGLALLLVCKEIYSEAKNVPFAENAFAFPAYPQLSAFLARVGAQRARRIESILIASAFRDCSWSHSPDWLASLPLHGLPSVRVVLEAGGWDNLRDWHDSIDFSAAVDAPGAVFAGLQGLRAFDSGSVDVVVELRPEVAALEDQRVGREEIEAWAVRTEEMILDQRNKQEKDRDHETGGT